ncbi:NAD(P)-binding domain-containing protein [Pseudothioclava arenosa]|uniref:Pyridine nucleotide-disulfide oxidoreductase n=1 Tax=Pseudothioclava arenosa TaxID=1795308 RepID=A0A2A4CTC2_9RHOB|nr:NAD(P)-binding domain-containing protein [Pseudothioclava arenosa]PCD77386.1 pyridine nucleotide-disulfide oxidoreductase [Pseudothioclava arenosa]
MTYIGTIIIGAGQAGLAMSRCLSDRGIRHVLLERGEIANSWSHERWDSLRLLTPNWQSRLPGFGYDGPDPDGFMSMPEIVGYLRDYARASDAPVEERTRVLSVTASAGGYEIQTNRGAWRCDTLVLASGACNLASVPALSAQVPPGIEQINALGYRNPGQLAPGGVLVVGASATGVQLAAEIRAAGHEVTLAAGEHIRVPRQYRGRDIQWWLEVTGVHATRTDEVDDLRRARGVPSLQLAGSHEQPFCDLGWLIAMGVEVTGRLGAIRDGVALFSGGLANHCALSDLKMNRLLDTIDAWAETCNLPGIGPAERFAPTPCPSAPRLTMPLGDGRIRTILWATGFRPDHSWLQLPVFDRKGALQHHEGRVAPGLYVLGLPFQRRRNSALLDGVGHDAAAIADDILFQRGRSAA